MLAEEFAEIESALQGAFASYGDLEQMLLRRLGENLRHYVPENVNLTDAIFHLVRWAETRGRTYNLIEAAYRDRPLNLLLQKLYQSRGGVLDAPASAPTSAFLPVPPSDRLFLLETPSGDVIWSGPLSPDNAHRLWMPNPPARRVVIDLQYKKDEPLCRALQRLLCHHRPGDINIEVRGNMSWMKALSSCMLKHLPTEGNSSACTGWNNVAAGTEHVPPADGGRHERTALADILDASLDRWSLETLHQDILAALNGLGYSGTFAGLEPGLAGDMEQVWENWHPLLNGDPSLCRRFFEMLLSLRDGPSSDWSRFGIGPTTIKNCMVPGTLFALAVTACHEELPLVPHAGLPGNLAFEALRGHACGADRAGGQVLEDGIANTQDFPWQSHLILLANYQQPPSMIFELCRSLASAPDLGGDSALSLRDDGLSQPVLVTFDRGFRNALPKGRPVLSEYLASVTAALARRQRSQLDLGPGSVAEPAKDSLDA
ncbi:ABC-three component system protein [Azospirillum palustre]